MDALLMCGGQGSRLDADVEKPLLEVGGEPMIDRVANALAESRVERVHAVCSPHAPATRAHAAERERARSDPVGAVIDAPGEGYVADLQHALERVDPPVVTVAADLPLLAAGIVDDVLDAHDGAGSLDVVVPAACKRTLDVSLDTVRSVEGRDLAPTGLNVVDDGSADDGDVDDGSADDGDVDDGSASDGDARDVHCSFDVRLAVNVNRPGDAEIADSLLADFPSAPTPQEVR